MRNLKNICVYCAASANINSAYIEAAHKLGALFASNHYNVICGAGRTGLMGAVTRGALEAGGKVIGVIPEFMVENGWAYSGLSEMVTTPDMHSRKEIMADRADAAVALPGGCGTFEELLEIITWKQLGLFHKPIIILNINNYYSPLIEMLNKAIEEGFMKPSHSTIWHECTTPDEAVEYLKSDIKEATLESKY